MNMTDIIFQAKAYQLICQEIAKGTLAKAVLIISKDSVYGYEFAKMVAVSLLNNGQQLKNENFTRVEIGSHPDVKTYPQKDKLLVSDSEEIVLESYALPVLADKKIFIIKDFDNSMEAAQNKLLKILEEPPHNVYFILTCSNSNLVLPTIRSRCNKYELAKLSQELIEKYLQGKDNASLITSLSDGYIGRAEFLSKFKNLQHLFDSVVSVLTKMKTSKQVLLFSKNLLMYKDNFSLLIEILSLALEDLLILKSGGSNVRLQTVKQDLINVQGEYSIRAICEIQSLLDKAVKEQSYNGNVTLIIENLLLNILEVKFICK